MSRKSVLLGMAILVVIAGTVGLVLALLVRREPDFYARLSLPPGAERQHNSHEFYANCSQLIDGIVCDKKWSATFTEAQINSYFDEDFIRSGVQERLLPEGMSQPRVSIGQDRVRIAFRYGTESWLSTVISIDLHVWLVQSEPNVVAMELVGLHAGSLPISMQSLLERVSEVARRQDIEVSWYRHNGNPVALLRFQAGQAQPSVKLKRLILQNGQLTIGGESQEPAPLRAMLMPAIALKPDAN